MRDDQPTERRNVLATVGDSVSRAWRPLPLRIPVIDPTLASMNAAERVAESLRYFVLAFEYWLSPGGSLRAWIMLNLIFAVVVAVPLALIFPLLTVLLGFLAQWSELALNIANNALHTVIVLAIASGIGMGTHAALKAYFKFRREQADAEARKKLGRNRSTGR